MGKGEREGVEKAWLECTPAGTRDYNVAKRERNWIRRRSSRLPSSFPFSSTPFFHSTLSHCFRYRARPPFPLFSPRFSPDSPTSSSPAELPRSPDRISILNRIEIFFGGSRYNFQFYPDDRPLRDIFQPVNLSKQSFRRW